MPSLKRQQCHMTYGIQNEECVREELGEKRCYAELLCQREAMKFYHQPMRRKQGGQKGSCSALVERFAFPENELVLPDDVQKSDRDHCRGIVHELAKCLGKHRVGSRADR
eukprot:CAMPEP_0201642162 /NCGR_PEP_ID=MMETSP0493-20130528/25683_1 /ASSEMBLY_ACC=CAM_ASM_000838 /TAXON_ID=420259 /ORGANISM="Thalassiosira gravida, Strain GMp14c1" /LENGTH=109 /DNA_ID=CAMNT_0048116277 /DNA_START=87 /DNA_END=416 /DNA_ORIENTATION=-